MLLLMLLLLLYKHSTTPFSSLPPSYAGAGMGIAGDAAAFDFVPAVAAAAAAASAGPSIPPSSSALRTSSAKRELGLFKRTRGRSNSTRRPFFITQMRSESRMVSNLKTEREGGREGGRERRGNG